MSRRKLLLIVASVIGTLGIGVAVWAYFTSTGSGTGAASIGSLSAPTGVTATASGTTVTVNWTGVTDPGSGTFGYYVTRTLSPSGSPINVCGSSPSALLLGTTCSDTSVASGTYTYKVTAVYNSWTATTAASPVTVSATPLTASVTFPANSGLYNAALWSSGTAGSCGTSGTICGVASGGSGIPGASSVALTIIQGATLDTWNGSAFASGTNTVTATTYNSGTGVWTYSFPSTDFAGDGSYAVSVTATDSSSNTSTPSTNTFTYDNTAPTVSATVIGQSSGAVVNGFIQKNTGYYVYANVTDAVSGVSTVTANVNLVTTGSTGVSLTSTGGPFTAPGGGSYTYRSAQLISNSGQADGPVNYSVNATDMAGNTSTYSNNGTVTFDTTAPTGTVTYTNGYVTATVVSVSFSATDGTGSGVDSSTGQLMRASASLSNGSCAAFGSFSNIGPAGVTSSYIDSSVASGNCYEYKYVVSDNVNNHGTITSSSVVKVDTTPPSVPTLVFSAETNVYATGSNVYYRPGATSGGFTVTASSTDSVSGIVSYSFPNLGSGWTASSGGLGVEVYSWSSANPTTTSGSLTVTATDGAGLTSSGSNSANPFTMTADSTAPTVPAPTVTAGYYTTLSVPVSLGTATDSGSGVNASTITLQRDQVALTNGSCGTFPGTFGTTVTLVGGNDTSVSSGYCYQYREQAADNVGNVGTSSPSNIAQVDTNGPSVPTLVFSAETNVYATGSTVYYRPGATSGGFTVTASSTDSVSGIVSYSFPSLGSGWTGTPGSLGVETYTWSAANPSTNTGSLTVTAADGAGLISSGTNSTNPFIMVADATAPSSGSVSYTSGYYTSASVPVTLVQGTDGTGSGVNTTSGVLLRRSATLSNNVCGTYGSFSTLATNPSLSYTDSSVASGNCYQYEYQVSDNVGNTVTYTSSNVAQVDTNGPSVPTLVFSAETNVYATGSTVYYRPGATSGGFTVTASSTDTESGIASYSFPNLGSGWTGTPGSLGVETYTWSAANPTTTGSPPAVTATNNAGLTSSGTNTTNPFAMVADSTAPVNNLSLSGQSGGGSYLSGTTVYYHGSVAGSLTITNALTDTGGSGPASSSFPALSGTATGWTHSASGTVSTPTGGPYVSTTFSWSASTTSSPTEVVTGTDNVGNTVTTTLTFTNDSTVPVNNLSLSGQSGGGSYLSGTTVYYQGSVAGSFTITNALTDTGGSGPASSSFPALGGTTTNWTHNASGTVSTPTGGPYVSTTFSWSASTTSSPTEVVTGTDNVGNTVTTTLTFTNDSTAPTLGAVTVNSVAATSGGSTSSATITTFTIGSRTDYTESSGSGLASSILTVQSETFTNNTCGAAGSGGPFTSPTTISGTTQPSGIVADYCYLYTLTGTDHVGNTASISTTVQLIGSAYQLVFTQQPGGAITPGTAFPTQPKVTVEDAGGNTVTTDSSTVTLTITTGTPTAGSGTLSGCSGTETSGVVPFSGCKISGAGTGYKLHAADGSLATANSSAFNVVGPAAKLVFTQSPGGTITGGVAFPTQPIVNVEDSVGNTVTTDSSTVTLAITSGTPTSGGPGTLSGCSGTETSGVVTFSGCKINTSGTGYKLHATDGSLTVADSTAFSVIVGPAAQLAFTTQPVGNVAEGTNFSTSPAVSVEDAGGNLVSTDIGNVTLAINSGPGAGSLSCSNTGFPTIAAVAGVATFTNCQITGTAAAGTYTLTATRSGLIAATSSNVVINPGTATQLVFTTEPGSDSGTGGLLPEPVVSVEDANGSVETGDNTTTVTLAINTNPGSGTLDCWTGITDSTNTLTVTVSAGVASFSGCGINQAGAGPTSGYKLSATSSPAHGTVISSSFSVTKSVPTITSPTSSSPCNPGHDGTAGCTITGTNFAAGVTVTLSANGTINSVTFNSSTQITINVTGSGGSGKTGDLTVTNPDGGSATVTNGFSNG